VFGNKRCVIVSYHRRGVSRWRRKRENPLALKKSKQCLARLLHYAAQSAAAHQQDGT
jgi:hypothetical protein